jgi:hypothetical protein
MRPLFCVLLFCAAAHSAFAQQARPRLRPDPEWVKKDNWERWQKEVPVSGDVRVGVVAKGDRRLTPTSLLVFLPSSTETTLCIELSSQDGRYSARLPYPLNDNTSRTVQLDLPTKYARELANYEPRQIAILASLGNGCSQPPSTYVLARWDLIEQVDDLLVLLNSRLPARIRGEGPNGPLSFDCLPLDGVTTGFNLSCEIPRRELAGRTSLVVEMRRGGAITRLQLPLLLR